MYVWKYTQVVHLIHNILLRYWVPLCSSDVSFSCCIWWWCKREGNTVTIQISKRWKCLQQSTMSLEANRSHRLGHRAMVFGVVQLCSKWFPVLSWPFDIVHLRSIVAFSSMCLIWVRCVGTHCEIVLYHFPTKSTPWNHNCLFGYNFGVWFSFDMLKRDTQLLYLGNRVVSYSLDMARLTGSQ